VAAANGLAQVSLFLFWIEPALRTKKLDLFSLPHFMKAFSPDPYVLNMPMRHGC
jgi:hypothetical protein